MDGRAARRATGRSALALGVALALHEAGCDSDGAEPFLGTWHVVGGQVDATCGNMGHLSQPFGSHLTVTRGDDSPLLMDARGCRLKLDIAGQSGVARPGQTCQTTLQVNNSNLAIDLAVKMATFLVNKNEAQLTLDGTASTGFLGDCAYHSRLTTAKFQNP